VQFVLPPSPGGTAWRLLVDTNRPDDSAEPLFDVNSQYGVTGRSLLLLALE